MAKSNPVTKDPIRLALIGCGTAGLQGAQCIVKKLRDQATIVTACDVNEDAELSARESLGIAEHCTDCRQVMDRQDVDAVMISILPGLHRDVTVAAARAGKHVFCEKPMAVELADCYLLEPISIGCMKDLVSCRLLRAPLPSVII